MDETAHGSNGSVMEALEAGQHDRLEWMRLAAGDQLSLPMKAFQAGPQVSPQVNHQAAHAPLSLVRVVGLPLPRLEHLAESIRLWVPALGPGGVLMVSSLGPGTLIEWRTALGLDLQAEPRGLDLHDLGDALSQAGLSAPVTESERVVWTYRSFLTAWNDLRGLWPATSGRGLQPRSRFAAAQDAFDRLRGGDGRVSLSFEWVHAHAWRGEARRNAGNGGEKPLTFQPLGRFG